MANKIPGHHSRSIHFSNTQVLMRPAVSELAGKVSKAKQESYQQPVAKRGTPIRDRLTRILAERKVAQLVHRINQALTSASLTSST